jgi:hypothetical protein
MKEMRARTLLGAVVATVYVAVTGSTTIAAAAETPTETVARESAENEALAQQEVQELASLQLPEGAVAVEEFAGQAAVELGYDTGPPAGPGVAAETTYWHVPTSLTQLYGYLHDHPPPSMRFESGWDNGERMQISFAPVQLTTGIIGASVDVGAVTRGEVSWVRVDDAVRWEVARSPAAVILGQPRFVEVGVWPTGEGVIPVARGKPQPPPRVPLFNSSARPNVVASIVDAVESLAAVQPAGYAKCGPPFLGPTSRIELIFRDRRGGKPLARAFQRTPVGGCSPFELRPTGSKRWYALQSGDAVLETLRGLLRAAKPRSQT